MSNLTLEWDSRDLEVWRNRGLDRALVRALSRAGNEAVRAMKAQSTRSVRQRKQFKVARVNAALPITFPRNKQDLNSLVWRMDVSGKPVPVSELPHRQTRKGVSVMINRGVRKLIKGAFIARMKSGHEGVFRRRGKARLPIDEAFTTKISDVFQDDGMIAGVQTRTQTVFKSAFARLLTLELGKAK